MDFNALANKYGTPLFVFNIDELKSRLQYLKSKLVDLDICYAIKANSFILKEIVSDVERLEVCSNGEYEICKELGLPPEKIVLSGVYKNEDDFARIFAEKKEIGRYTIESYHQYEMLKSLVAKYQKKINLLIRYTSGNQFGVNEEEVLKICQEENPYINIMGLEYFAGTQKHNLRIIEKEMNNVKMLIAKIEQETKVKITEIEYGTGLPVYYFQGEDFAEDEYLEEFNRLLHQYFTEQKIILEIGRSLVADMGYYLTKVVDMKENKNGNFVILDGGINHLVYYGQTMAMKIPYFELLPKREGPLKSYNLCGALCTINDLIVKQLSVPELKINDLFVFKKVGAYSVTEGIGLFLSRDLPKVVLIKNKKEMLVREDVKTYKINKPNYEGE